MDQKSIWGKFILAQEKILTNRARPIAIDTASPQLLTKNKLTLHVDQEVFKRFIKQEIIRLFKLAHHDFSTGHILQDLSITEQIAPSDLSILRERARENYIELSEFPIIEGEVRAIAHDPLLISHILRGAVGNANEKDGQIFLTLEEAELLRAQSSIVIERTVGAIFKISPSIDAILSRYYRHLEITVNEGVVSVSGHIHQSVIRDVSPGLSLRIKGYSVRFRLSGFAGLSKQSLALLKKGIELPRLEGDSMCFNFEQSSLYMQGSSFVAEVYRIMNLLSRYFPSAEITYLYTVHYYYSYKREHGDWFFDHLYQCLPENLYQFSRRNNTLSFDFSSREELDEKIGLLREMPMLVINDLGKEHRYKFRMRFELGLAALKAELGERLPNLSTRLRANGQLLSFHQLYIPGNKMFLRDELHNTLSGLIDTMRYRITFFDTYLEKYRCEENFEQKRTLEEERLKALKGESFGFGEPGEKLVLGRLMKANYPELEFFIDEKYLPGIREHLSDNVIAGIYPELKGERDKIIRLSDAINKLFSIAKLPNNNATEFLFNSTMAKGIPDIDLLLDPHSEEWLAFSAGLYAKRLNESQKQAVFKALYAPELALIQGPPGTGKSTAIAEVIWQHVLRDQKLRILLTSETNLAVDNAIDRLKNPSHNIVKPLRFGNSGKLESEGRFYSMNVINEWTENGDGMQDNVVVHWLGNIASRVQRSDDVGLERVLENWRKRLKSPSLEDRKLFSETYIRSANLIGATGSSIGKLNSEGKFTSFFRTYLNVYERDKVFPKINMKHCSGIEISFDVVIMDEASKATPPELVLPILHSKKAVIVGDHRQLPPMVDGDEIKDVLFSIGETKLAKSLFKGSFAKSQFENLFERINPSIKGTFDTQYRMHPAINDVIAQFYLEDGGLRCGLPLQESFHQGFENPMSRYHGLHIPGVMQEHTHVLWIDVSSPELKEDSSRVNFGEIAAIDNFLSLLKKADGFVRWCDWLRDQSEEEREIGLISFYGKQVNHLQRMLEREHSEMPVRLSTVDRFQGMERNIIIVSMVRSDRLASEREQQPDYSLYGSLGYAQQADLGFAESPNRLNVALSRARRLLVIVGNKDHFCRKEIYRNVYQTVQNSANGNTIDALALAKIAGRI